MLKEIRELSDHMFWADGIVWDAVRKLPNKEIPEKIIELLHHIHTVQNSYLDIWSNKQVKFREIKEFQSYSDIADWGLYFHKRFKKKLDELNENNLEEIIEIPWTKSLEKYLGRPAKPSSLTQQIFQVIMHSTYHRGQVNKLIREAGGEPPLTDYIYWIWIERPRSEWIITT